MAISKMKDEEKTKEQLRSELEALRRRVVELEGLKVERKQAEQMKGMVNELVALVGGSKGAERGTTSAPKTSKTGIHKALAGPAQSRPAVYQAKEVSPEQVIPMADEDFKDF
jgi:hypothetical protein